MHLFKCGCYCFFKIEGTTLRRLAVIFQKVCECEPDTVLPGREDDVGKLVIKMNRVTDAVEFWFY